MIASQALPPLIPRQAQGQTEPGAQLLQLGHDAVGDADLALGVEQVHQPRQQVDLAAHRQRQEVCVNEDGVGRAQALVCVEEEMRRLLRDASGLLVGLFLVGRRLLGLLLGRRLEPGVARADDALGLLGRAIVSWPGYHLVWLVKRLGIVKGLLEHIF